MIEPLDDNRKIGTMDGAPPAGHTTVRLDHHRMVVGIFRQHLLRAEGNAQPTPLAPILEHPHLAPHPATRLRALGLLRDGRLTQLPCH